ncbi:MAG: EamA family transporter [Terriglobus roseus]|nr:EamA family transporter [Terriglobus roseus]
MADSSPAQPISSFKFPPAAPEQFPAFDERARRASSGSHVSMVAEGQSNDVWVPRRSTSTTRWANGGAHGNPVATRHGRQKSLTEALRNIRGRNGSVSAGAQEIADALKAPVSYKLIVCPILRPSRESLIANAGTLRQGLCAFWYTTSIMSNMSSKVILTALPKPVTLTIVQFAFVCSWCMFLGWMSRMYPQLRTQYPILKNGIRPPTRDIVLTTLPLTFFQIAGHILSSDATSRIPVSLVHTIKGLSPLFTVLAFRFFLGISYSWPTYLSLIPLTVGVAMACSADLSGNFIGIMTALASALLFVTQNIVSKKLFNEAALAEQEGATRTNKPDKLNLLCYSSGLSFLFTAPIWLLSEGRLLIGDVLSDGSFGLSTGTEIDHGRLALEYVFNGTFHFLQSLVAFILLSMISPVTYSVASLFKRIFVILFAIVWFGNQMTSIQAIGILLTFLGLYLYDRVSDAAKADRKSRALQGKDRDSVLPLTSQNVSESPATYTPVTRRHSEQFEMAQVNGGLNGYASDGGLGRSKINTSQQWLPPGTRQEDTWTPQDTMMKNSPVTAL